MEKVEHPQHYNKNGIECFDIIKAFFGNNTFESFCLCNALKYIVRSRHKGNYIKDIEKAKFYLEQVLEMNYEEKNDDAMQRLKELSIKADQTAVATSTSGYMDFTTHDWTIR